MQVTGWKKGKGGGEGERRGKRRGRDMRPNRTSVRIKVRRIRPLVRTHGPTYRTGTATRAPCLEVITVFKQPYKKATNKPYTDSMRKGRGATHG